MLEERFKTVDRDLAKRGLAAGYRKAEFEAAAAAATPARESSSSRVADAQQQHQQPAAVVAAAPAAAAADFGAGSVHASYAGGASLFAQPSMLMTGSGPAAPAAPASGRLMAPTPEPAGGMGMAAAAAGGGVVGGMGGGAPHYYQPLQSFASQPEVYAEFERCLRVLENGELRVGWGVQRPNLSRAAA
jgi:hypothetical protein